MARFDVIGLGAMNMDNIFLVPEIAADNEVTARLAGKFPGGSAANTIYALGRLGLKTGFIGAVGKDIDGRRLKQDFLRAGVDVTFINTIPGVKTGMSLCLSDPKGNRSIYLLPEANDHFHLDNNSLDFINQAQILHVSSFAGPEQWPEILKAVSSLGPATRLSFSPGALYARSGIENLAPVLRKTYVLFLSYRELEGLTGTKELSEGAQKLLGYGCGIVAVTLGAGIMLNQTKVVSYVRTAKEEHFIEDVEKTHPVDTTGAGDGFAAGFLLGLRLGQDIKRSGRLGALVANFSVKKIGPRAGLPIRKALEKRYLKVYDEPF